jgi:hypothetical protein
VLRHEGETVVVRFDEVGYKTLATALAVSEGLVVPAGDNAWRTE